MSYLYLPSLNPIVPWFGSHHSFNVPPPPIYFLVHQVTRFLDIFPAEFLMHFLSLLSTLTYHNCLDFSALTLISDLYKLWHLYSEISILFWNWNAVVLCIVLILCRRDVCVSYLSFQTIEYIETGFVCSVYIRVWNFLYSGSGPVYGSLNWRFLRRIRKFQLCIS
jgi:hypothetical protein